MRVFLNDDDVGHEDGDDDKVTDCCPDAQLTQKPRDLDSSPTSSTDMMSLRWGQEVSEAGEQRSKIILEGTASRKFWLRAPQQRAGPPTTTCRTGLQEQVIQILCCLLISSLGAILVSAPYSSHFQPIVSTILMSGYPFVGAPCFAITGSLSIISGEKATKPFAVSSLTSSAVSSLTAGAGLFLLADGLAALETASRRCDSEREYLSTLPYSMHYYSIYEFKGCLPDNISLTGVLVVMLVFTVLELLLATYASVLWWKEVYSNNRGSTFSLPRSYSTCQKALQGHV
ncbi:membrane-spanning 4-domains subfamily A member 7 [Meles meles]|uniref:membrane-spanning 4-domains subfamily A member 7 n=1 Tax=Meles meles TaxID=9662 RepID=UPI001E69C64E|nr:membrane-spanning 4-domains subfamily A member 7 [Meles meles]